jgi:hypothetical protein
VPTVDLEAPARADPRPHGDGGERPDHGQALRAAWDRELDDPEPRFGALEGDSLHLPFDDDFARFGHDSERYYKARGRGRRLEAEVVRTP